MRASNQAQLWGALGVCLLSAPLGRGGWDHLALPPPSGSRLGTWPAGLPLNELAPAHSPASQALREARQEWIRAEQAAARELEAWPEAQPDGILWHQTDAYREHLMALDRGGDLRRARAAARRAAALARSPAEVYHAAAVLARIECDAGDHTAELWQARRMVALRPRVRASWESLKHAAVCKWAHPARAPYRRRARSAASRGGAPTRPNPRPLPCKGRGD
jgi:hypothetical protein